MPDSSVARHLAPAIAALALLALPKASLAQGDLDLISAAGVAPNVVLYLDTSGTMLLHAFDDDFNSKKLYPPTCWQYHGSSLLNGTYCPGLGNPGDKCANANGLSAHSLFRGGATLSPLNGDGHLYRESTSPGAPSYTLTCDPPDGPPRSRTLYVDAGVPWITNYSRNYLNWLFGVATPADLANEPTSRREQRQAIPRSSTSRCSPATANS